MNAQPPKYTMRLSLHVLEHLGINLYSNVPSVLSEVIANAWDADAQNVKIVISEDKKTITITDDGIGMTELEINERFLLVGYKRRGKEGKDKTPSGRPPMGRKGIGKMSLFSIAHEIEVHTKKESSEEAAFSLSIEKIKNLASTNEKSTKENDYCPNAIEFSGNFNHGTKIVLKSLTKDRIMVASLPKSIASRFSVRCLNEMSVSINGDQVTSRDSGIMSKMEYLLTYGNEVEVPECPNVGKENIHPRTASFDDNGKPSKNGRYKIHGWIGMTKSAKDLQSDEGQNLNSVSVYMRGKMAKEDLLENFSFSSFFSRYVIGEIHADFLDDTQDDLATSSRQDFLQDAPEVQALAKFLKNELKHARTIRDNSKEKTADKDAMSFFPGISDWLDDMDIKTHNSALKFLGKINKVPTSSDEEKKILFQHGILAFQDYLLKGLLDELKTIRQENIKGFLSLVTKMDELEASYYYKIARSRLNIIKKFHGLTQSDEKEKILQEYLFKHLWLIDPSWDRATTPVMEKDVINAFKGIEAKESKSVRQQRIDIGYLATGGTHVIVELKRYSVRVKHTNLIAQVDKYRKTLRDCLRKQYPNNPDPDIDVVCIIGEKMSGWEDSDKRNNDIKVLRASDIEIRTYDSLICNALLSYGKYFEDRPKKSPFLRAIASIDDE